MVVVGRGHGRGAGLANPVCCRGVAVGAMLSRRERRGTVGCVPGCQLGDEGKDGLSASTASVSTVCFPAASLALLPEAPVLVAERQSSAVNSLKLSGSCQLTLIIPRRGPQNAGQCRDAHGSLPMHPHCRW